MFIIITTLLLAAQILRKYMTQTTNSFFDTSFALVTDLYQLTMAYGYWKTNLHEREAVFNLYFRRPPFQSGYTICAGLGLVIEYLQTWQFSETDIAYLATIKGNDDKPLFDNDFLNYLTTMQFNCDIDAMEEGDIAFPHEPLLRIKGPLLQCQLLETPLLNIINFQSLIATKAARICYAAKGEPVLEFGLRRAQGFSGGLVASRAAYIGGCTATSNLQAGKLYGIPVGGTHAHSWVMSFPEELTAFKAYAENIPNNCVFLVDTYNTLEGVRHAIEIGKLLKERGQRLIGIRLDSGDLAYLSIEARKLLDQAGFNDAAIIGSNDLDEHVISSLKDQGATINVWGVGTKLATAYDQPALNGVYKLAALKDQNGQWQYKLKLSEQITKISTPGMLQVRRYLTNSGAMADAIYDEILGIPAECVIVDPLDMTKRRKISLNTPFIELLKPVYRQGKLIYQQPVLSDIRQKAKTEIKRFHESIRRFLNPHIYPVGLEEQLFELKTELILKARRGGRSTRALILVDLQNDFMPGGSLPVTGGNEIMPIVNELQKYFDLIVATKDWHPVNHGSFASNHKGRKPGEQIELAGLPQTLWPDHCVQHTQGADFVNGLDTKRIHKIFHKGTDPNIDSYSTFFDNAHRKSTGLDDYLKKKGIEEVYILGVATDYCVKFSVLDACMLGFKTYIIADACRAVNLQSDDETHALAEMQSAGARVIKSNEILI